MSEIPIQNWISQAHTAGLTDTQITEQLVGQGWTPEQIHQVLTPAAPLPPPAPTHANPADIAAAITGHRVEAVAQPAMSSAQGIEPATIGAIYRSAFRNYGERLLTHLGFGVIAAVVGGIFAYGMTVGVMTILNGNNFYGTTAYGYNAPSPVTIGLVFIVIYSIVLLVMTTIGTWLWSCITISASTSDANRHFLTIAKEAARRIPQVWVANFVSTFILSGTAILAGAISFFGSLAIPNVLDINSLNFIIHILIFLLAAGLISWVGTYLCFTPFIALSGRARALRAVLVSDAMVRGSWWKIFGKLVTFIAPAIVISILISILLGQLELPSLVITSISSIISLGFLFPLGITYALGVFNGMSAQRPQIAPSGKGTAIALLTVGSIGWLLVFGVGSIAIGGFYSLFGGYAF